MQRFTCDIAVIGGGPAGMAAALEARRGGASVILLERNFELGGILQQCIHDGFGLQRFGSSMSGASYAQHFIDEIEQTDITVLPDTMVLEITADKCIFACNSAQGILHIQPKAIVLAMGCRERTAGQILLHGQRPQGVLTAGAAQRYINIDGYLPGKTAVVLGSGDIGLIMARRMTLEGIDVKGVYEVMPTPGGLTRNLVQCLDDFSIPLHLQHTVVKVHGASTLEGVTVAALDENKRPIAETEQFVACDLLVLSVGLIPENELSAQAGIALHPQTRGPIVDETGMTSLEGVFACGNVVVVYDLVDYVSQSGEIAARGALRYLKNAQKPPARYRAVRAGSGVSVAVPQRVTQSAQSMPVQLYLRAAQVFEACTLTCTANGAPVLQKRLPCVEPTSMLACTATIPGGTDDITLTLCHNTHSNETT